MKPDARRGDDGTTSLFGGQRVDKDAIRLDAYGTVDELNSQLGLARAACGDESLRSMLVEIQTDLFAIGSDLATPADSPFRARLSHPVGAAQVARLENWIDQLRGQMPEIAHFVLPGGSDLAARLHVARSVCRRAERAIVRLARSEQIDQQLVGFANRLSDLLFESARRANQLAGVAETFWQAR